MNLNLKVAIAEPSAIIRCGVEAILRQLHGFRIQAVEICAIENLAESLKMHKPELLIINPAFPGYSGLQAIKDGCTGMKCMALVYNITDSQMIRPYDDQVSLYDSPDEIRHKLERLFAEEETPDVTENEEQQTLSVREKEIVTCVVKGMTNREIADKLFLSTHTVITHRRNIARKLQIHSASGLTIYAIVNKLVELKDIQQ